MGQENSSSRSQPCADAGSDIPRSPRMSRVEDLMRELTAAIREEVGALPTGVRPLAEEIREARNGARLSLQEVADRSGFTKSHVWELEQGRSRNPTVLMLAGLSRALGVPFHRLAEAALLSAPGRVAARDMGSRAPQGASTALGGPKSTTLPTSEEGGR